MVKDTYSLTIVATRYLDVDPQELFSNSLPTTGIKSTLREALNGEQTITIVKQSRTYCRDGLADLLNSYFSTIQTLRLLGYNFFCKVDVLPIVKLESKKFSNLRKMFYILDSPSYSVIEEVDQNGFSVKFLLTEMVSGVRLSAFLAIARILSYLDHFEYDTLPSRSITRHPILDKILADIGTISKNAQKAHNTSPDYFGMDAYSLIRLVQGISEGILPFGLQTRMFYGPVNTTEILGSESDYVSFLRDIWSVVKDFAPELLNRYGSAFVQAEIRKLMEKEKETK